MVLELFWDMAVPLAFYMYQIMIIQYDGIEETGAIVVKSGSKSQFYAITYP